MKYRNCDILGRGKSTECSLRAAIALPLLNEQKAREIGYMGETLNLLFRYRDDGSYELQVRENWSGRTVSGSFVPPYTSKQLNALQKRLNKFNNNIKDLHEIGNRLFLALCGSETPGTSRSDVSEQSVQALLRSVIQRTLRSRGTVAFSF